MWKVVTMRADYEGWWLFDDWTDHIIHEIICNDFDEMLTAYNDLLTSYKEKYANEIIGKYNIHAFYNNCDIAFCEDCEEDLQIFYSILILNDNSIYTPLPN